jgi:hypothetical protein
VPHRIAIGVLIEVRFDEFSRDAVFFSEELGDERRVHRCPDIRAAQIKFDAIAGAEDHRLDAVAGGEFREGMMQLRGIEGELLAKLDRGRLDVAADRAEVHEPPPGTNGCDAMSATSIRTNAAIDQSASRRPGTFAA